MIVHLHAGATWAADFIDANVSDGTLRATHVAPRLSLSGYVLA
jgi:hypothetical protein